MLAALALAVSVAVPLAAPPPISEDLGFRTPSGNVVCAAGRLVGAGGSGLLCVVFSASDRRGERTWYMRRTGPAGVRFLRSNIRTEGLAALAYGRSWSRLGFRCASRRTGLTCRNRSRHGFFLSRESQRRF